MDWLDNYRGKRYRDGGRGPDEYDCWGLVREVRHVHLGFALLPEWGDVRHTQPARFTRAYEQEAANMEVCAPEHGAIAACFRGRICVHVALVVHLEGRLDVIETNQHTGFRRSRLRDFESRHLKVIYYRDRALSEQA